MNPRGTTINLFDYDNGGVNGNINDGHVLHFGSGVASAYDATLDKNTVNQWTGAKGRAKPAPRQGIVQNQLGSDGYPVLSKTALDGSSLNYLFNGDSVTGKTSYLGVDGLLRIDDDGYYYYNSQDNFAQFNDNGAGSGSFALYDTWGVTPVGTSPNGQFFPFNTGDQVFDEQDGQLVQKSDLNSGSNIFNHYFGMSMSTRFVQQYGGHVDQEGTKPVTYNFSGDDDVWVYIDDVLVGDLGGIHDQVSLQINFATGEVVVYSDGRVDNRSDNVYNPNGAIDGTDPAVTATQIGDAIDGGKDVFWQKTTLKELFKSAGVDVRDWDSDTLPDNTYHTLDFFYMERGGSDSNMALRYNLVSIPDSGIVKIDQDGHAMAGVNFTLQQANKPADGDYQLVENGMTVTGTTGANGDLILTHASVGGADGTPYTLDELGDVSRYWILTENNTPDGYRGVQPVHLYFAYPQTDESKGAGPLLVANQWDTGAYSAPHVTVQADATVHGTTTNQDYDLDEGGTLFAVVMKHIDANNNGRFEEDETTWAPVSGGAFEGWTVHNSDNQQQNIIAAAQANPYIFTPGTNGSYETTIEDLPGDIRTYRHVIQEYQNKTYDEAMAVAEYSVAYFYTTGDLSAPAGSEHAVTDGNTAQISSEGGDSSQAFDRIFSVTLNVPNIKNELSLVKTDATTDKPIEGVEFKLYNADGNGDPTGDAINTLTTGEDGTLQVYSDSDSQNDSDSQILAEGSYVLVETTPEGYADQNTTIPVVVDDSGVYANAGTANDNVTVETGLGTLVYSMKGFAAGDQIDATLHDVKAQPQKADKYSGVDTVWTQDGNELHLKYVDDKDSTLNYQGTGDSATTHTTDAGWSTLTVQQCMDASHQSQENGLVKKDLGNTDLSALFTGDVTIHVTNDPTTLKITKNVEEAPESDQNKAFHYTIKLTRADGAYDAQVYSADDEALGTPFKIGNEGVEGAQNSFDLRDGQYIVIKGLPVGASYTITEMDNDTYTEANTVDRTASENGLIAKGTMPDDGSAEVVYTNTYQPLPSDATAAFSGKKTVKQEHGDFTLKDDQFTFQVKNTQKPEGLETAPMPSNAPQGTVTNDADGNFSFGTLTFTEPGIYAYTVSEVVPTDQGTAVDGITYSGETYTLTFKVEDKDKNGKFEVTSQTITNLAGDTVDATNLNFENIYNDGRISYQIVGTKVFDGNDFTGEQLDEGEFSFALYEVGADDTETLVQTVQNGAPTDNKAAFQFDSITYTDPGKHTYKVYEIGTDGQPGTGGVDGNNVAYSGEVYTVVVTVEKADDEAGQRGGLKVSAVTTDAAGESADAISFTNSYEAKPTSATIEGTKIYNDADGLPIDLQGGEFTFVLSPIGGAPVPQNTTTTNKADGTFSFDAIEYAEEGTYTYTVNEQADESVVDNTFITYDDTVYYVKVEVTEDKDSNSLVPKVTYYTDADMTKPAQNAAFTNNQYKPKKDAKPESGSTVHVGDTITYTIHYKNTENSAATVTVEDVLDKGLTYVENSAKVNDNTPEDGQFTSNGQTLTWTIQNVSAGDEGTVSFQATVNESAVTKVDNQAKAQVGDSSKVTTNPTTHPVEGKLTISKTVSAPEGVTAPEDATFTFKVYVEGVTGEVTAKDQDNKDVTLTFDADNTATVELKANESITIPLPLGADYTVTEENSDRFEPEGANPVTGTVGSDSQVSVNNKYTPDGQNEKSVQNDEGDDINGQLVGVGDTLTYEIDWVNDTGKTATVTVTDAAPTGTEYVAGSASLNNDPEAQVDDSAAADGGNITWTIADVEPGAAGTVSFQVKVLESAVNNEDNTIKNAATVTIDNNPKQTNEVTNLVPEKSVDNTDMTRPGEELTYTVSFIMDDEGTATVEDLLSTGLAYKANTASYTVNGGDQAPLEPTIDPQNQQQLTWSITDLKKGDEVVLTFTVSVTNDVTGDEVPNTATVNGHQTNVVTTPVDLVTEPVPVPVTITKTLEGRDWVEGDAFSFTLTGQAAEGSPEDGFSIENAEGMLTYEDAIAAVGSEATEGVSVNLPMGSITFTKPGTYHFTVTETSSALPGVVAQTQTRTFTITVTEQNKGTLVAVPSECTVDFVNTYRPTTAVTADLTAQKTVNGASKGIEAGKFTFAIENVVAPEGVTAPMPSNVAADGTVSNDVDGVVHFGTLTFNAAGTYVYRITEVNDGMPGVGYDDTTYYVVYTVESDPVQGGFVVSSVEIHRDSQDGEIVDGITFANTYEPAPAVTEAPLAGEKTVTVEHGDFTLQAGQFAFQIRPLYTDPAGLDAPMPSLADENGLVTNDANGAFDFGTFTFTRPGTYVYEVREVDGSIPGITYDGERYLVSYTVEDQGGQLVVTDQTIVNAAGETVGTVDLDFRNVYNDGQTSYQIAGIKLFDSNGFIGEKLDAHEFSFALYEVEADGTETLIQTVSNGVPAGNVAGFWFDPIIYTEPGVHTYKVYEIGTDGQPGTGGVDGNNVTYSREVYTVIVTVEPADGAAGQHGGLKVSAVITDAAGQPAGSIEFTNSYEPRPTDAQIGGTKVFVNADGSSRQLEGGEFTFVLLENGQEVSRTTNAADGSFVFEPITYTEPGVHHYVVVEVPGDEGYIDYDNALYFVTVEVTENPETNALEATVTYHDSTGAVIPAGELTFTNVYTPAPTDVILGGVKELVGRDLTEGEFSFQLIDPETGEVLQTVSNGADGSFVFEPLTFDAPGTYQYVISEVLPQDDDPSTEGVQQNGVTYDQTVYTVEITVVDNGSGALEVAGITYNGAGELPVFTNTYEEPEIPNTPGEPTPDEPTPGEPTPGGPTSPEIPDTGDATNGALPAILAVGGVALVVIGGVYVLRRRSH